MSKKNPFRSFWDFEPSQANKRNPFAVDPEFDSKKERSEEKGPAITSLPRNLHKTMTNKRPLTKQQAIQSSAPAQKSYYKHFVFLLVVLVVAIGLGQSKVLKSMFQSKKDIADTKITETRKPTESTDGVKENTREAGKKVKNKIKAAKVTRESAPKVAAKEKLTLAAKPIEKPAAKEEAPAQVKPEVKEEVSTVEKTATKGDTGWTGKTVYVKTSFLNVRSQPSLDAKVVDTLKAGDKVVVEKEVRKWLQIGEGRFIGQSHVSDEPMGTKNASPVAEKKETPSSAKASQEAPPSLIRVKQPHIALENVKIRAGAGPKNKVVGYLKKGTVVTVFEQKGVWARIGDGRYVHIGNLSVVKQRNKNKAVGH